MTVRAEPVKNDQLVITTSYGDRNRRLPVFHGFQRYRPLLHPCHPSLSQKSSFGGSPSIFRTPRGRPFHLWLGCDYTTPGIGEPPRLPSQKSSFGGSPSIFRTPNCLVSTYPLSLTLKAYNLGREKMGHETSNLITGGNGRGCALPIAENHTGTSKTY